jgi:hypothetical protein
MLARGQQRLMLLHLAQAWVVTAKCNSQQEGLFVDTKSGSALALFTQKTINEHTQSDNAEVPCSLMANG